MNQRGHTLGDPPVQYRPTIGEADALDGRGIDWTIGPAGLRAPWFPGPEVDDRWSGRVEIPISPPGWGLTSIAGP
jgi:hypothetical protein